MSTKRTYLKATDPKLNHVVEFKTKSKFISSLPETMKRGAMALVETNALTIAASYVIPDGVDAVAIIVMPVVNIPYLLFVDTDDNSLKLVPAVYKDAVLTAYSIATKGAVIGYTPNSHKIVTKDLQSVIEGDDKVNYTINAGDIITVEGEVISTNDPALIHNRTVIRGLSEMDRSSLDAVAHFDVLAVTLTTTPVFKLPLWYFENLGSGGKNLRYAGMHDTNKIIFTIGI